MADPKQDFPPGLMADGSFALIEDFDAWKEEREAWEDSNPDDIGDLDDYDDLFAEGEEEEPEAQDTSDALELEERYEGGLLRARVIGGKQSVEIIERPPEKQHDPGFVPSMSSPMSVKARKPSEVTVPTRFIIKHAGGTSIQLKYEDAVRTAFFYARRAARDEATFKENEHPRDPDGKFTSGGWAVHSDLSNTNKTTSSKQDVTGIDDLYEKAKAAEPGFKKAVERVAAETGGTVMYTPLEYAEPGTILKSRKSAQRKLAAELGGDASELKDVIRATVVHHEWTETRSAAIQFMQEHAADIVRVKDRVVNPVPGGYRDLLINYRTSNGLIAEVQFNTRAMVEAKNGAGHQIYEKLRELVSADRPPPPPTVAEIQELEHQQYAIYDRAYHASGNGNWSKGA